MAQRIILHFGTPKTGTTALQRWLFRRRGRLARQGLHYPRPLGYAPGGRWHRATGAADARAKHQWMIGALMDADGRFVRRLDEMARKGPADARLTVLSTEGLYNRWWDFPASGAEALREASARFDLEAWVWLREPVAFFRSVYVQKLRNPPSRDIASNGRDWSCEQMLDDDWFRRRLDYAGFLDDLARVVGAGRIRVFGYRGQTVADFLAAAGVAAERAPEPRENRTLGDDAVTQLRRLNARDPPPSERPRLIASIVAADARRKVAWRPFELPPASEARVRALTGPSLARLYETYGLDLR
jgi:hypothetical protein